MTGVRPKAKRILVVDNEPKFCRVVSNFLQTRGYEVAVAADGDDALVQLERFDPEVVLMDVIMPGRSYLDLLHMVRARVSPPRVIMVTVADSDQHAPEALKAGAEAFVSKPVNFDELERIISQKRSSPPTPAAPS